MLIMLISWHFHKWLTNASIIAISFACWCWANFGVSIPKYLLHIIYLIPSTYVSWIAKWFFIVMLRSRLTCKQACWNYDAIKTPHQHHQQKTYQLSAIAWLAIFLPPKQCKVKTHDRLSVLHSVNRKVQSDFQQKEIGAQVS